MVERLIVRRLQEPSRARAATAARALSIEMGDGRPGETHVIRVKNLRLVFIFAIFASMATTAQAVAVFATIDGEQISYDEFERLAAIEVRQTFYHGAPENEAALIEFRREIADKLIDRKLLLREARRRGLNADEAYVNSQLSGYEKQYGNTERWQTEGEQMLAKLRTHFEQESLLAQVNNLLHVAGSPGDAELMPFYEANIDKFTEPKQVRVSVILLRVEAWANAEAWDAARTAAETIADRIRAGESFAELARSHSDDSSAANGGDMGYLHAGTLSGPVQAVLDGLSVTELAAEPVRVLEGIVVVRLDGRRPATVRSLDSVRKRAVGLWQLEMSRNLRDENLTRLRKESDIRIDEEYLERLPGQLR